MQVQQLLIAVFKSTNYHVGIPYSFNLFEPVLVQQLVNTLEYIM